MASKDKVLADLSAVTDKLSSQVRTVSLGVLALAWGLLLADKGPGQIFALQFRMHLVGIGGGAILVMFLDFLQYVAGYLSTRQLLNEMEQKDLNEGQYDYNSLSHKLRRWLFGLKQIALICIVVWLLCIIGWWMLQST